MRITFNENKMKTVRYNDLEKASMNAFRDGDIFEVVKETKKQLVISKDGREHTIHKRCLDFFTIIK